MRISISIKLAITFFSLSMLVLFLTFGLAKLDIENRAKRQNLSIVQHQLKFLARAVSNQLVVAEDLSLMNSEKLQLAIERIPNRARRARLRRPSFLPREDAHRRVSWQFTTENTQIIDLKNKAIVGKAFEQDSKTLDEPIRFKGYTIGYIRAWLNDYPFTEQTFINSMKPLMPIFAGSLFIALVVSIIVAFMITLPIKRIVANISRLSSGKFDINVKVNRKDELGVLIHGVNHLSKTLDSNRKSRNKLFADISHELRTPLTIMSGEIEMLKDGLQPFDAQSLNSLDTSTKQLRSLVDDLYQLALSDSGGLRYQFKTLDISKLIEEQLVQFQQRFSQNQIKVSFEKTSATQISGDEQRLKQLFCNLFENSLNYTDALGEIRIKLYQQNNEVFIIIEDSSPGISEHQPEELLEPLVREEASRNRNLGGAGLGLAICNNIVLAHRGKFTLESSNLGGVKVSIQLPTEISQK